MNTNINISHQLNIINQKIANHEPIEYDIIDNLMNLCNSGFFNKEEYAEFESMLPKLNNYPFLRKENNLPAKSKPSFLENFPFLKKFFHKKDFYSKLNQPNTQSDHSAQGIHSRDLLLNNLKKPSIILVSDIHGDIKRWNIIKRLLMNNQNLKVIIEGDTTDKGPDGINILLQIREFALKNQIIYVPGNHDLFLYDYVVGKSTNNPQIYRDALALLYGNKGETTMNDMDNFEKCVHNAIKNKDIKRKVSKEDFINWLGNCPIQLKINESSVNYAISHALFDEKLYTYDKNFNLAKAFKLRTSTKTPLTTEIINRFENCLWFRENEPYTHSAPIAFPQGCVSIVGHTRQTDANVKYLNDNPNMPMVYIDCNTGNFQGYNLTTMEHIHFENQPIHENKNIPR